MKMRVCVFFFSSLLLPIILAAIEIWNSAICWSLAVTRKWGD